MMFQLCLPRRSQATLDTFPSFSNLYKARKPWPPDFSKLGPGSQFRFEKKYRRRAKLKYQRPVWMKGVAIFQWATCLSVAGWMLFIYDWEGMQTPLPVFRAWIFEQVDSVRSGETNASQLPGFVEANIAKDNTRPR